MAPGKIFVNSANSSKELDALADKRIKFIV